MWLLFESQTCLCLYQRYKPKTKQNTNIFHQIGDTGKNLQRTLGSSNNVWEQFYARITLISKDTIYFTFSLSLSINPNLGTSFLQLKLEGLLALTIDYNNTPWLTTRL